jgi:hypothetical protein
MGVNAGESLRPTLAAIFTFCTARDRRVDVSAMLVHYAIQRYLFIKLDCAANKGKQEGLFV